MKLWLDDVRQPPDETWEWARTNEAAMAFLRTGTVTECSLDHDLGLNELGIEETDDWDKIIEITYAIANATEISESTGLDLVEWMVDTGRVPDKVTIHSWNPDGAMRMAQRLAYHGYDVTIDPYNPKRGR